MSSCSSRACRATSTTACPSCARQHVVSPTTRTRPSFSVRLPARRSTSSRRRHCPNSSSTSTSSPRAAPGRRRTTTREPLFARPHSRSSPRATVRCYRSCSVVLRMRMRLPRIASRRSTSRISSSAPATCCSSTTGDSRGGAASLPLDHGGRVPGHEPAANGDRRPAVGRAGERVVLRRRRVPVDLRVPPRRCRRLPGASRVGALRVAADPQLPVATGGARRRQRAVRRRVRRRLPAARPRQTATATRCWARPSSCSSPTRRPTPTPASTGAGPRRVTSPGASESSSTSAPRLRARSCCSSPPAPTPSGSRRSCARSTCRPIA